MEKLSKAPLFSERRIVAINDRMMRIAQPDRDFLVKIAAEIIEERLSAVTRDFDTAIDVFSPFEAMVAMLEKASSVDSVVQLKPFQFADLSSKSSTPNDRSTPGFTKLQLKPNSANLITSLFSLHRSNSLPAVLKEIREALISDGLFMAAMPGDQTLKELRECIIQAESELAGAVSLRVDPFGEVRQYGSLLQSAGFSLPVVDSEIFTLRYQSVFDLISDLRAMGATSALAAPPARTPKGLFRRTDELLHQRYGDPDGKFRISVEMVFMSGWSPHESQQKPMKPGSAKHSLKDFL